MLILSQFTTKLSHRLILNILFFSGIITLFITVIQLYIDYKKDISYLHQQLTQIEESFLPSFKNALWKYNRELLETQVVSISKLRDINYVAIHDTKQLLFSKGDNGDEREQIEFKVNYNYNNQIRNIGLLVVTVNYQGLYDRLYDRLLIILMSSGIKTFATSLFMLFLFNMLVMKNLNMISNYFHGYHIGKDIELLSLPLSKKNGNQSDEFREIETKVNELVTKVSEAYEEAQKEIKILSGLLPICSHCKKIRNEEGYWDQIETYIDQRSEATFSHSICSECSDELYGKEDWYIEMKNKKKKKE